jgi:hypothetical protein
MNLYSNPSVVRGFINSPNTYESFYLFDSNTVINTFSEAAEGYYTEVPIIFNDEPFSYTTGQTLTMNIIQECSESEEFNGIRVQLVDEEGIISASPEGVQFTLVIYLNDNTLDENQVLIYELGIRPLNYDIFLPLSLSLIGQITLAEISTISSTNPINKTLFVEGTFTSCNTPTPTPTSNTWTPTPTPSNEPTPSLTKTPTPTPTLPLGECWSVSEIYGSNVYVSYIDREGTTQCITISNLNTVTICIQSGTENSIQGYDTPGCTGNGLSVNVSNLGRNCTSDGSCLITPTPTTSVTPTNTLTPTIISLTPISLANPQSTGCVACGLTSYGVVGYVQPTDTLPELGDIVYSNSIGSSYLNGASQWWKTTWGNPIVYYSLKIDSLGQIIDIVNCVTCGAIPCDDYYNQTGSNITGVNFTDCNGVSFTNYTVGAGQSICVEQGTLNGGDSGFLINLGFCGSYYPNSTPTPTPSITPSVDPYFYYDAVAYNCGLSGEGCGEPSTGNVIIRFSTSQSGTWYGNGITAYILGLSVSGPSFDILGDLLSTGAICTDVCAV